VSKFSNYFALSIYRDKIVLDPAYRAMLVQRVLEMESAVPTPGRQPNTAWLGDTRGAEFLFRHPDFAELYRQIGKRIVEYVEEMGVDSKQLAIYYQRSWATVTRHNQRIHEHAHVQSNLTFAYYLQKPNKSGGVYFTINEHPNEFSPGLFSPSKAELGLIKNPSMLTWNSVLLNTEEGDLVIFPSKTLHGTTPSESDQPRISLSADISIMLKDSRGHETMMPHFSNWSPIES
jgi:uncharacterized protein (TIGR02466 family)